MGSLFLRAISAVSHKEPLSAIVLYQTDVLIFLGAVMLYVTFTLQKCQNQNLSR